ncbi:pre-rRNA processing protein [Candidozyma auris]
MFCLTEYFTMVSAGLAGQNKEQSKDVRMMKRAPKKQGKKFMSAYEEAIHDSEWEDKEARDRENIPGSARETRAITSDAVKQAPVRGQKNKLKFKKSKNEDDWSDNKQEEA